MKITYYGTAAAEGWPALFCSCDGCKTARRLKGKNIRTRSQALINDDLLIDFPADTYLHVLNYGLDLENVENILFTHSHEDHLYAEDLALRQDGYSPIRSRRVIGVYGNEAVKKIYDGVMARPYNSDAVKSYDFHAIEPYQEYKVGNYTVYPLRADHDKSQVSLIYLIIDGEGKALLYAHDTGYFFEDVWDFLKEKNIRLDYVSLDCTCGKLTEARTNHMGLECCGDVKRRLIDEKIADVRTKFTINHFSHNSKYLSHEEMEKDAARYGFAVAYDSFAAEV